MTLAIEHVLVEPVDVGIVNTPRAQAAAMLNTLPEARSFVYIHCHLYVLEKIKHGPSCADSEDALDHEVATKCLSK